MAESYEKEIIMLVQGSGATANNEGKFIFDTWDDRIVVDEEKVMVWVNREIGPMDEMFVQLVNLPEDRQWEIFNWVSGNAYNLRNLTLETTDLVLAPVDEAKFVGEPREVFGVNPGTGLRDVLLGRLGVVLEPVEVDKIFHKLIFISVDGTWATLTMWPVGDVEGEKIAMLDANFIAVAIAEYVNPQELKP